MVTTRLPLQVPASSFAAPEYALALPPCTCWNEAMLRFQHGAFVVAQRIAGVPTIPIYRCHLFDNGMSNS
jgi:hypothetical protein